jgi:ribosomal protein L6P/L9E
VFSFVDKTLRKKISYCESVSHLIKFSFINPNKGYICYLRVKGVGYKLEFKNSDTLLATLGHSHKISIKIPTYLKVCILKKRVILWSYSLVKLQQFCYILTELKRKDPYNGKGLLQPHLQKKLKIGKISRV